MSGQTLHTVVNLGMVIPVLRPNLLSFSTATADASLGGISYEVGFPANAFLGFLRSHRISWRAKL